jgi:hypothetical protein
MPTFIQVKCGCGRSLRARPDQAGTVIPCWECKAEILVPYPDQPGLAVPMAAAGYEALRPPAVPVIAGGAAVITAALLVPHAGIVLALCLVVASVHYYGDQVRAAAHDASAGEAATARTSPWAALVRMSLAVVATLALVAPVLIRNAGHSLPPAETRPVVRWLAALALAGWLVAPVLLLAASAHDRHGPLPPRLVLGSLARHPLATLVALLVVPLALILTEAFVALAAWQQGQLPLMVVDLFPPPDSAYTVDGRHLYFDYDGTRIDMNYSASIEALAAVYPQAFRHGFTLIGTIPPSLSMGLLEVRGSPRNYYVLPVSYLFLRVAMTMVILSVAGVALRAQARWLGLIAALGAHRPRRAPDPDSQMPGTA